MSKRIKPGLSRADILLAQRRAFGRSMSMGRGAKREAKANALAARNAYRAAVGLPPVLK